MHIQSLSGNARPYLSGRYELGLSQICSKFAQNASRNFPKISPIMFFRCSYYAPKLPTINSIVMENLK